MFYTQEEEHPRPEYLAGQNRIFLISKRKKVSNSISKAVLCKTNRLD